MIALSSDHAALLATRMFWSCDLYAITMIDGTVVRYVQHGIGVPWNGYTWQGGGPKFQRDRTRLVRGLDSDQLTVHIVAGQDNLLLGIPFVAAVMNGALDGARLELWRGHAATPGAPLVGAILRFAGEVQDINTEETIRLTVKSDLVKLDAPIPRAVFQPGCDRTLYAPGCDVSRAAHQITVAALSGSTQSVIKVTADQLGNTAGYYTGGEVRFISGANAGARRSVKVQSDNVTLELAYPLLQAVVLGDEFTLVPGCKHDEDDCANKFGNTARFRGQPYIPVPETML